MAKDWAKILFGTTLLFTGSGAWNITSLWPYLFYTYDVIPEEDLVCRQKLITAQPFFFFLIYMFILYIFHVGSHVVTFLKNFHKFWKMSLNVDQNDSQYLGQSTSLKTKHQKCIKLYHFWNPYDRTNNLTLFSEKSGHVSILDSCVTPKVNGNHLGNVNCHSMWHTWKILLMVY